MNSIVEKLLAGNRSHAKQFAQPLANLGDGQQPEAVTVCCSDSRVLQDHMWGNAEPGKLFTCGNIGNRVGQQVGSREVVAGDILYPIAHTDTTTAIVVGHTECGAVTATYEAIEHDRHAPPGIKYCIDLLKPHIAPGVEQLPPELSDTEAVNYLVEYNVDEQIEVLLRSEDVPNEVDVVGAVYDFRGGYPGKRGEVHVININGHRTVEQLQEQFPAIADRIHRLWLPELPSDAD